MYRLMFGVLLLLVMSASPAAALGDCADCDFEYNSCVIDADRDADSAAAAGAVLCAVVAVKNAPAGVICFFGLAIVVRDLRSDAKWDCLMEKEDCEADCTNANRNDHGGKS